MRLGDILGINKPEPPPEPTGPRGAPFVSLRERSPHLQSCIRRIDNVEPDYDEMIVTVIYQGYPRDYLVKKALTAMELTAQAVAEFQVPEDEAVLLVLSFRAHALPDKVSVGDLQLPETKSPGANKAWLWLIPKTECRPAKFPIAKAV